MRKQRFMDKSLFVCNTCGNTIPLMRRHGSQRERGHIKDLWCPYCKADRKFAEIRRGDFAVVNGNNIYM